MNNASGLSREDLEALLDFYLKNDFPKEFISIARTGKYAEAQKAIFTIVKFLKGLAGNDEETQISCKTRFSTPFGKAMLHLDITSGIVNEFLFDDKEFKKLASMLPTKTEVSLGVGSSGRAVLSFTFSDIAASHPVFSS